MRYRRILFLLLFLSALGIFALQRALLADLPAPGALITRASPDTTKLFDRHGRLLFEVLDPRAGRRTGVALNELPLHFRRAVIAVEDANFYENPGIDALGILRALIRNLAAGEIVSGGSTITQQLARAVLLAKEERESRNLTRKLRESVLAFRLTQTYSKDRLLEMYLNEVYFGQLAYGAEAASRAYFGKPARDLDLAESALLAGLIQSPAAYNPLVNFNAARERQRVVLNLMLKHGFIGERDAELASDEPLHFAPLASAPSSTRAGEASLSAPHFVTFVRNLLEAEYGAETVNRGGLRVLTTLDLDLQERAETIIRDRLAELRRRTREENAPDYNVHDAALVALDPTTSEILAMVGSADYFDASIDGAVNVALSNRQPGSAIKPLTYAAAFTRGLTPATVLSDVPTIFQTREQEPYAPQNYDHQWRGPISLRRALATSSNLVAVKVLDYIGLDALIETAKSLGITTFDQNRFGLALTLGGGEVKLVELTSAYAAFANGGRRVQPTAILRVSSDQLTDISYQSPVVTRDSSPETSRDVSNETKTVLHSQMSESSRDDSDAGTDQSNTARVLVAPVTPQVAYLITSILSDDTARISAFGEDSVLKLSRPAAAKTGTTSDFRDNWTVGYTPDLAVGVWVGNANNEPMYKITGITGAAPIWHDFMEEAHKGKPIRDWTRPDGLVEVEVCETSGLRATQLCPRVRTETFIAGAAPTTDDDSYHAFALDSATGLLWSEGCRGTRVERVFWLLPPDAQEWGRKQGIPEPPIYDCDQRESLSSRLRPTGVPLGQIATKGNPSGTDFKIAIVQIPISIVSPAPNSIFQISPQIPLAFQQIEVSARLNGNVALRQVWLVIDGQTIATFTRSPYRALWQLTVGEHEVKAIGVDEAGKTMESELVKFRVIGEQ